jgi:uncharacterized PurR-regulated membrane protein YhhQ (DUF165 family)
MDKVKKFTPIVLFALVVFLANWLTTHYGIVSVGFGLMATAGTYAAGVAFGLRDWCQETSGRWGAMWAVLLGAALSAVLASGRIAVASAVAFLLSELLDLAIYTPLRNKNKYGAIVASNTVGSAFDTVLFLSIAGFGITSSVFWGQMVGKGWMTLAAVLALAIFRAKKQTTKMQGVTA